MQTPEGDPAGATNGVAQAWVLSHVAPGAASAPDAPASPPGVPPSFPGAQTTAGGAVGGASAEAGAHVPVDEVTVGAVADPLPSLTAVQVSCTMGLVGPFGVQSRF